MSYLFTFVPMLSLTALDPLGGVLVWGTAGLIGAVLAAALLGMALNALLHQAATHDRRPHTHSNPPDEDFRQAA
jgi:hypothetical protein